MQLASMDTANDANQIETKLKGTNVTLITESNLNFLLLIDSFYKRFWINDRIIILYPYTKYHMLRDSKWNNTT